MSMQRILMVASIRFAQDSIAELAKKCQIEASILYISSRSRKEFLEDCAGKYEGITALYCHPYSQKITGPFDKELINALPSSIKFICYNGAGYDPIDVIAAGERGIYVSNTPTVVDAATADIAMILILNACRNIYQSMVNLREGRWNGGVCMGTNPSGKILGILGMGGIGKAVAKRAIGFDMKIQYHNRSRLDPEVERQYSVTYVDFETLLRTSDVISVNVPLNKQTTHLLGTREFAAMKDGAILVNTARGKVLNEDALVRALDAGKLLTVGLDVFEEEPKIHPGLLKNPRVILLPHIGTNTREAKLEMEQLALKNLESCLSTGQLLTPVAEHSKYFQVTRL